MSKIIFIRSISILGILFLGTYSYAQEFAYPPNAADYPIQEISSGEDLLIEAEDALLDFAPEADGGKPVDEVYQVVENENARNGYVVNFLLDDPGGRFTDWSLTFPFELTEESRVRILLRIRFFNTEDAGEGKAYVKMDDNEYDTWPDDFLGFNPVWGFDFPGRPEYDGGGWTQINNWSNRQRKENGEAWGEKLDFRTIWCEGNWWGQEPDVEILEWQLPAGVHTFKMSPRSGGSIEVDWVVIKTSDFQIDQFAYEVAPHTEVPEFMLYQ